MIENLFLSVGAMKAGTTWLYEQLKDHPDIYFTPEKEIHYFANKVGIENQLSHKGRIEKLKAVLSKYHKGNLKFIGQNSEEIAWYGEFARPDHIDNEWYEGLFRYNPGKKFSADFSNLYCQMEADGWENVRKVANNLKVIYTLRDPLDRLWSHYKFHTKWVGREDEVLSSGFDGFKDLLGKRFFWVNSEYSKNYELIRSSVESDEFMILYFEDFRKDPSKMLTKIHDFLGIESIVPEANSLAKKVNKTKEFVMPDEWKAYALERLSEQYSDKVLIHDDWKGIG